MIQIPLSPEQFATASAVLAKQGIAITGDKGEISKSGVTARYGYADGQLTIDITHKPFFVTTEYCEEQIKGWLAAH
jgi:hypothetical protein